MHNAFPARLKQLMEQNGVSQIELADGIGVVRQTVSNYLRGMSEPELTQINKTIAFFKDRFNLDITADYLIGDAAEMVGEPKQDENPYIKQDGKVIRFDLARIEHGKAKLCQCEMPHFEIDSENRLVMCSDCGAVMDPFEVLLIISRKWSSFEDYQKKALAKIDAFSQEANRQFNRRMRNGWFKDMEREYLNNDMLPVCPHCGQPFDPIDSVTKINRNCCGEAWKVKTDNREAHK